MNNNTSNVMDYWPFEYNPRPNQIKALQWLAEQDSKYLILEAPVGSGKSNLGITYSLYLSKRLANFRGDSFILTPQRILQKQYEQSFNTNDKINLASFYGKTNYKCQTKNCTCELGSLVKPRCQPCVHQDAKKQARIAANTVLNYKLALTSFAYTDTFTKRELMILDECHTLEEHLVNFDSIKITDYKCKKYKLPFKIHNDIKTAYGWLKFTYLPALKSKLQELEDLTAPLFDKAGHELSMPEIKRLQEVDKFADHVDEIRLMTSRNYEYVEANFVLVWDKFQFQFKRLTGEYSFNKLIEPFANKFLFMSSTILNKEGFCEDLGIDPEDTSFLSLDSEFPVENRPIYYIPQMKMNYTWNQAENISNRKQMVNALITLLQNHSDQTGIIHTSNFAIAEWLVEELTKRIPHDIFHHNPSSGDDRNAIINAFLTANKPSILISPSSTEGLDLKEDLGRFAIFVKVPYGNLTDQWIKRRMHMSNEWYTRRALIDIIQGGGRIVRSETDKGTVYILDGSFDLLYKRTNSIIPNWWKQSYTTI